MFAQASSLEPCFVLAWLLVGFLLLAVWYHRRGRVRLAREPEDRSALLAETFVIKPYVQLGNNPRLGQSEQFEILWHAKSTAARKWQVQARVFGESTWRSAVAAVCTPVTITALGDHLRCSALISGMPSGAEVEYRVLYDGDIAFAASMRTRNSADQAFRIAIAGDIGDASQPHMRKIAYHMHKRTPNLLVIPGDIVYDRGRVSEYMRHFFPVLNSDTHSKENGAPLLRSVLTMACVGNHDVGMPHADHRRNFTQYPDLLGYYLFHSQPLNGPDTGGGANMPFIEGDEAARKVFLKAAGERYPRMANFSFEWGNTHWLVLDANAYMDWTNRSLRSWVAAELKAAQGFRWRFVMFHQPAFTSDRKHSNEQRMRLLTPIFQEHGVDVVFVGHVHCYERTRPLRFTPHRMETKLHTEECPVAGDFTIDTKYDGAEHRRPDGIIYVTSGAGGARIHKGSDPGANGLKPYTAFYSQEKHSFTLCDVTNDRLLLRQVNEEGEEIDRFVIEK